MRPEKWQDHAVIIPARPKPIFSKSSLPVSARLSANTGENVEVEGLMAILSRNLPPKLFGEGREMQFVHAAPWLLTIPAISGEESC